jgi:hypothetical protein
MDQGRTSSTASDSLDKDKRLEPELVRTIFESLHLGLPQPKGIHFTIYPVGPKGTDLSPPPYEFPGTSISERVGMAQAPQAAMRFVVDFNAKPVLCS